LPGSDAWAIAGGANKRGDNPKLMAAAKLSNICVFIFYSFVLKEHLQKLASRENYNEFWFEFGLNLTTLL
jgi:hypothetical protein